MNPRTCQRCGWVYAPFDRFCWRCYVGRGQVAITPPDDGRDYFNLGEDDMDRDADSRVADLASGDD